MGNSSKKSTTTYRPNAAIEAGANQALGMARQYASQPYQIYTGQRVADLSGNENQAYQLASTGAGGAFNINPQRFTDADIQAYMNPYIKGALDPAAREISLAGAQRRNQIGQQAQSVGAFSGSRQILREREADKGTEQALSDLYGRGYAEAFDRGAALWAQDEDRALRAAGMKSDILDRDIARLMTTGQNARQVDQMIKDFDYQQFIEKRDWTGKNAAYLADVVRGLGDSMTRSQTTKEKSGSNALGQILGAAVTLGGAYFTGGGSLAGLFGGGAAAGGAAGGFNTGLAMQAAGSLIP